MDNQDKPYLLAGDTGGTKTLLALVAPDQGAMEIVAEATFESRRYRGLEEIVAEFLAGVPGRVRWASFSVCGPVIDGGASLQNLDWRVERSRLRGEFGLASVQLINDLQATAYALPHLGAEHVLTLQAGRGEPAGPRAVIAPGTGLGEAFLLPTGAGYQAYASEGGNADFAPTDGPQSELLRFLREHDDHISYEDVCSGRGIPNIYRFLRETGAAEEPAWLAARLAAAADPTPVIVETALDDVVPDSICARTLRIFASILAAEAGNLALRVLATGGVYLGGGIPPRILSVLRTGWFLEEFRRKGWFTGLLAGIPVHVILEPRAALLGAARYGLDTAVAPEPARPVARV